MEGVVDRQSMSCTMYKSIHDFIQETSEDLKSTLKSYKVSIQTTGMMVTTDFYKRSAMEALDDATNLSFFEKLGF